MRGMTMPRPRLAIQMITAMVTVMIILTNMAAVMDTVTAMDTATCTHRRISALPSLSALH